MCEIRIGRIDLLLDYYKKVLNIKIIPKESKNITLIQLLLLNYVLSSSIIKLEKIDIIIVKRNVLCYVDYN